MRDFYDIYIISKNEQMDYTDLSAAFHATCKARNSEKQIENMAEIYASIADSEAMKKQWRIYKEKNYYVGEVSWKVVTEVCKKLVLILNDWFLGFVYSVAVLEKIDEILEKIETIASKIFIMDYEHAA